MNKETTYQPIFNISSTDILAFKKITADEQYELRNGQWVNTHWLTNPILIVYSDKILIFT